MALLLLAIYAAVCIALFKLLHVPANKWTLATAALGGFAIVGGLLLAMNYNHPFTTEARLYFYTTPVVPQVKGRVFEVPIQPNETIKTGDVLFRIDPEPHRYAVDQRRAALAEAEQNVKQLEASLDAALANVESARATRDRTKQAYDRYAEGNENARRSGRPPPFSELEEENRRGVYLASEAAFAAAQAGAERARLAAESQIDGTNTTVARLQADLRDAEYDLEQTTVRAPTDGYVTQLFLKPGMMAVPLPLAPVMVFVHRDDTVFAAAFPQNWLQRLTAGSEAEVAFDAIPGRVFQARVRNVVDAVSQGQLQPSGMLLNPEDRSRTPGRALVGIEMTEDLSEYQLPAGSTAQVAVYTDHLRAVAVIRRILLRMKSWLNFVAFG